MSYGYDPLREEVMKEFAADMEPVLMSYLSNKLDENGNRLFNVSNLKTNVIEPFGTINWREIKAA